MDRQDVFYRTRKIMDRALERIVEVRTRLGSQRADLARAGHPLSEQAWEGLRQLDDLLLNLNQHFVEIEQTVHNLGALAQVSQVVNSTLNHQQVLQEVMDTIIDISGAERAFLMHDDGSGKMEIVVARNWEKKSLEDSEIEISSTIVREVLSEGKPVLTTNARADPRFDSQDSIIAYNLRSILCVPLQVKGILTGVIYADNRIQEGLFTDNERSLLTSFANQAAVALENARLFQSVQDSLAEVTELKNLMEDVFDSMASGVITTDMSDQITLCNRAAKSILGSATSALLGTSLLDLLFSYSPALKEKVSEVKYQEKRYVGYEVHPVLPERGEVSLNLNLTPLKSVDNRTRGVTLVIDDLTEKRKLQAQHRMFERMVSPAVIEELNPDRLQLGGHRADITILFADIRGFTAFGETIDPEVLMNVLNQYLSQAADAILAEEGTIDKFIGDAILAWFNAPILQEDHILRAVKAAVAIRDGIQDIHRRMPKTFRLPFGIGIHSGEAILGLVGSQRRLEYTAIGDSVNTARRIQENAGENQILISRFAASTILEKMITRPAPSIQAAGKEHPIDVLEILDIR
ncbi:MAG: GAF domain-containing protein [Anaerolineales bacterium]|nr:GAF domain-containing protein [Anaerolineales bacterium]